MRELREIPLLRGGQLTPSRRFDPGAELKTGLEHLRDSGFVFLYTDGACRGNPGPGGWAALIFDRSEERSVSGCEPHTTNQRMELMAAIQGLGAIAGTRQVALFTDSSYVMNCFRDRWWEKWERNGWLGSTKQPVTNRDLWERLIAETRRHTVTWFKVKGHSGHPENDRVDLLARQAIAAVAPR